ncbi:flagellar protein [Sulfurimonas aquatica]|uniref:Flagellar protein n=1 Tax=Sulfurimonas aquatica TaxID=2672570 RepID=A0A975AYR2_9BACT|nr:flagellar protein [Sulfurimonas aquatica]QSZ40953.1 flagellar protein [Sulfurimonas aquatica]
MFKWILLPILFINLYALEVSMDSAKDDFLRYSILNISDSKDFVCEEQKNDFEVTTEIICAFLKRPSQSIKKIQNDFFKVDTFIKKDTFFISVKPYHKIKLRAEVFDLTKDSTTYEADVTLSKKWIIFGYEDKLPLIKNIQRPEISINFPFFSDKDKLPYVGSLDIKGNPVHIKKVGDVTDYLQVKKYYKAKKYEQCMELADDILMKYPNTLFKAELLYYKIKLYSKLKDYDNVISHSKVFLREYSSDENIPEILSYTAKAYAQIGINIDADYFFDRLFSEHPDSVYTQWAYIYKGEMFEASGGDSKAVFYYKKALYETQNVDVAVSAAYKLAFIRQSESFKDSAKYIDKIINANQSFFMHDLRKSKTIMHNFADGGDYETAQKIANALLNSIDATNDDYETYLSEKALWLAKTDNKQDALVALNTYLKQFPDGEFEHRVQIAKDALFFDTTESNSSVKLVEYDKLIEDYANDSIGNRALYEKAKLQLSEGMYSKVLEAKEELSYLDIQEYSDTDEMINEAAIGVMKKSLESKECKDVLVISNDYNITLSNEWDDGIYDCAMMGGDYQLSKNIAEKNLKSEDISLRKKWLYRYIKVDFATGNYSNVIDASKDLIALIEDDKDSEYKDIYRYIFDTYDRVEKKDEMVSAMSKIENIFGTTYIDIDRYIAVMSIGSKRKDDTMVISFGSKVMDIQRSSNSKAQSPYVEFTLYQSYINKEDYIKALEVIESLDNVELDKTQRARQKYLLGTTLTKLWRDDEAKVAYKQAIEADGESAWAKLAKSAQEI